MQRFTILIAFILVSLLSFTLVSALDVYGSGDVNVGGNSNTEANGLGVAVGSDVQIGTGITVNSTSSGKIILSNGSHALVSISSADAKQTAQTELQVDDCSECRVELREVRARNEAHVVYHVMTYKEARVLGLFQTEMRVATNVDTHTGAIVSTEKPWWAFLAVESHTAVRAG